MDNVHKLSNIEDATESQDSFVSATEGSKLFYIGSTSHTHEHVSRRQVYTQYDLDHHFKKAEDKPSVKTRIRRAVRCKRENVFNYFSRFFPIFAVFKSYKLSYILDDFVSGITIGCLSFPLGIAFGVLASLRAEYGLYSSFSNVLVYMLFGTSRHVSFGTNGIISLFTSELVHSHLKEAAHPNATNLEDDIELKSSIASGATCIIGLILLLMGLFRLGFIVSYVSSSFVCGFTTAGGVHIVTSMLPSALGLNVTRHTGPGNQIFTYKEIFESIPNVNIGSLVASLITIAVLLFFKDFINVRYRKKLKTPIPIDFIVIIIANVISYFSNLNERFNMSIIGDIPAGLPPPRVPYLSFNLVLDSAVVAIMIFMLSVSMSRLCEAVHSYRVDDNQELVAYGLSNFISSFFQCFPSCAGPARTITLCIMGPKSTLHALVSTSFIIIILFWIGPAFRTLPKPVLASMVIVAVKNLVTQLKELPEMWRLNRYDFFIATGTILCGVLIDFPYALYVGVILCLLTVVLQSQNPKAYLMAKLQNEDRFLNTNVYQGLIVHPRIKIFKFESSLYFATAERFRRKLHNLTDSKFKGHTDHAAGKEMYVVASKDDNRNIDHINRESVLSFTRLPWDGLHDKTLHNKDYIIVDCSSINYIDINGLRILIQVICEMENDGITIVFANCNRYVKTFFKKSELSKKISEEHIFPEVSDAYNALIM